MLRRLCVVVLGFAVLCGCAFGERGPVRHIGKRQTPGDYSIDVPIKPGKVIYSYKNFHGFNVDCKQMQPNAVVRDWVGWGQIEWYGSPCSALAFQHAIGFDLLKGFVQSEEAKGTFRIRSIILNFDEKPGEAAGVACPQVFGYKHIACWTNGNGDPEPKPNGCVVVYTPSINWTDPKVKSEIPTVKTAPQPIKVGPTSWDITQVFDRDRLGPGLGVNEYRMGLLVDGALGIGNLTGEDSTNCISSVTNLRYTVNYTILPDSARVNIK